MTNGTKVVIGTLAFVAVSVAFLYTSIRAEMRALECEERRARASAVAGSAGNAAVTGSAGALAAAAADCRE